MISSDEFYLACAGICATVVSIISGFLLTWALQRRHEARNLLAEIRRLRQEVENANDESSRITKEVNSLESEVETLRNRVSSLRTPISPEERKTLAPVKTRLQELKEQIKTLRPRLGFLANFAKEKSGVIADMKLRVDQMARDVRFAAFGLLLTGTTSIVGVILPLWIAATPNSHFDFVTPWFLAKAIMVVLGLLAFYCGYALLSDYFILKYGFKHNSRSFTEHFRNELPTMLFIGISLIFASTKFVVDGPNGLEVTLSWLLTSAIFAAAVAANIAIVSEPM
ncbi:hypothetical protein BH09CHL1_BH09CHL1_25000 [soil metagenome]